MRPGQATGLWLPNGRFVTRWKEQRPSANNAVTGQTSDELCDILGAKFGPEARKNIGVFEFVCWADQHNGGNDEERGMLPEPVVAFASVLSKAEITARLEEVAEMVRMDPDEGPLWVEIFVRARTPVQDEDARQRFKPRPRGSRRTYRRD